MGYNILIVDDMFVDRELIKAILERNLPNLSFFEAEDGVKALHIIYNQDIDIILLDLLLPGKDGYEVLKEIKARDELKEIPVIINSALNDIESVSKALKLGALDYFIKPLDDGEIHVKLPLKVKNAIQYYEYRKKLLELNKKSAEDLMTAKSIQMALIPESKAWEGLGMSGKFIPCDMLGGDFYDCIMDNGVISFIIADIIGHGLSAAIMASFLKGIFMESVNGFSSPDQIVENINKAFCSLPEDTPRILSAFVGVIEGDMLFYTNAGHPYPVLVNPQNSRVEILEQNGYMLGIFEDITVRLGKCRLQPGDTIIAYTDGLFDLSKNETFNYWEEVAGFALEHRELLKNQPETFIQSLITEYSNKLNINVSDDISVMLLVKK